MSYSQLREENRSQRPSQAFILQKDVSNRHATHVEVKKSSTMTGAIPFPRDVRNVDSASFMRLYVTDAPTVGSALKDQFVVRRASMKLETQKICEKGWQRDMQPISSLNERWHNG
jgi:hypothetical protein